MPGGSVTAEGDPAAAGPLVAGIERQVFGDVGRGEITAWLRRYASIHLSAQADEILFTAGRLAAVYGLGLTDGTAIAVKVHRGATDLGHLTAAAKCQRRLVDAGFPCPLPLQGPVLIDGRAVTAEQLLTAGERADAHEPGVRRSMARGLAEQVALLQRLLPIGLGSPPAWAAYENGPWPTPHDPIFDFRTTPAGFDWLDELAARAAAAIGPRQAPDAVGHGDWVCQNLRFTGDRMTAAYDWDSLICHSEVVLVGLAAGAFTEGSSAGADAPTPAETKSFVADYEHARGTAFGPGEIRQVLGAVTWVLTYNARCDLSLQSLGVPAAPGSALMVLSTHRDQYLQESP